MFLDVACVAATKWDIHCLNMRVWLAINNIEKIDSWVNLTISAQPRKVHSHVQPGLLLGLQVHSHVQPI